MANREGDLCDVVAMKGDTIALRLTRSGDVVLGVVEAHRVARPNHLGQQPCGMPGPHPRSTARSGRGPAESSRKAPVDFPKVSARSLSRCAARLVSPNKYRIVRSEQIWSAQRLVLTGTCPIAKQGEAMSKLIYDAVSAYRGRRRSRIVPMEDIGIGRIRDGV